MSVYGLLQVLTSLQSSHLLSVCMFPDLEPPVQQISLIKYRHFQRSSYLGHSFFPWMVCRYPTWLLPNTTLPILLTTTIELASNNNTAITRVPFPTCAHGARPLPLLVRDLLEHDGTSPHGCFLREDRDVFSLFSGATLGLLSFRRPRWAK